MDPRNLPEFVHELAEWTRQAGGATWAGKAAMGSPFYWPPGITDPGKDAQALANEEYNRISRTTKNLEYAHSLMQQTYQDFTTASYQKLAEYHAETMERAKIFYIGKDASFLAGRTEMKDFRLDADLFQQNPGKSKTLMSCGIFMWDTPIGEAEPRGRLSSRYDTKTGELLGVTVIDDMMADFRESDNPINAATWRILPGGKEVLVVFYTDGEKARVNYEKEIERQLAELPPGKKINKEVIRAALSDPQPLEREQVLPIGKTLAWFEDKEREDRLRLTITSDPSYLREAERGHVADKFEEANEKIAPMLSQMVKTFVATLALRRMKIIQQETVTAPTPARKRMRRAGAPEERQQGGVQVVRVGAPIKRRSGSGGGGKWKVKTIIGPVIRTRQYVPAYDEYRDGIWEIEPYIAGPEDAPWSENVKVFLID